MKVFVIPEGCQDEPWFDTLNMFVTKVNKLKKRNKRQRKIVKEAQIASERLRADIENLRVTYLDESEDHKVTTKMLQGSDRKVRELEAELTRYKDLAEQYRRVAANRLTEIQQLQESCDAKQNLIDLHKCGQDGNRCFVENHVTEIEQLRSTVNGLNKELAASRNAHHEYVNAQRGNVTKANHEQVLNQLDACHKVMQHIADDLAANGFRGSDDEEGDGE